MATAEQVTQLLGLMQQQLTLMQGQQTRPDSGQAGKSKRPDRPIIEAGIDDREWALFQDTWGRYKKMIGVVSTAPGYAETIRNELRSSCTPAVNKMLFEFFGATTLDTCSEETLLTHIKSVAVKETHQEVHRMNFGLLSQEPGESITHYVARLKAKAFLCKFEVVVPTDVACTTCDPGRTISYADQMVAQRLVAGLYNLDHRRRVLAEATTLTTLDAKVKRLQLLETTEESATILHRPAAAPPVLTTSEAAMQRSQYKRDQATYKSRSDDVETSATPKTCRGCGRTSHPQNKPLERKHCPAFKKKCDNCHKKGHLAAVCEQGSAAPAMAEDAVDNGIEDIAAGAFVSFAFGAQDFRPGKKQRSGR